MLRTPTRRPRRGALALLTLALTLLTGFDSEPLVVTVDRTAPTVTTRTPTPGGSGVWLGEPIRVAFSEPLDAATLTDTTVELLDGATPLAKTIELDPDVGALTLTLEQAPVLPTTLSVALSPSIADRAGNALALPGGAWSWDVGAYALYGALNGFAAATGISFPSLVTGSDNLPIVVWPESDGSVMRTFVRRWDGGAWQPLGDGIVGFLPSLVIDDTDRPVVALLAPNGSILDVEIHRWDGAAWTQLGSTLSANPGDTNASKPSLAFDGDPWIAWPEGDGSQSLYVQSPNTLP